MCDSSLIARLRRARQLEAVLPDVPRKLRELQQRITGREVVLDGLLDAAAELIEHLDAERRGLRVALVQAHKEAQRAAREGYAEALDDLKALDDLRGRQELDP